MPLLQRIAIMEIAVCGNVGGQAPIGNERSERQQELRVDRYTAGVQRSDSRGSQDHITFVRTVGELAKEGGLACSSLAREENVPQRTVDEARGQPGHFCDLMLHFAIAGSQVRKLRRFCLIEG